MEQRVEETKTPPVKGVKNNRKEAFRKEMQGRISFLYGMIVLVTVIIGLRILYLQVWDASHLSTISKEQANAVITLISPRGTIYDRNGRALVESVQAYSLYVDPVMLKENTKLTPEEIAPIIAPYVTMPETDLIKAMTAKDTAFVWIQRLMDKKEHDALQAVLEKHKIVGFAFRKEYKRYYLNGTMLGQVLGFVNIDGEGIIGLEKELQDEIKGDREQLVLTRDRWGNPIMQSVMTNRIAKMGNSVTLTVDTTVQYIAERALAQAMASTKAQSASVIIMDPKTGDILAMANQPEYDPNHFEKYNDSYFVNRAVTNLYEPGSTFKPIVAAAALAKNKWSLNETYHDVGFVKLNGHEIQNWDEGANGVVTLTDILKYSINTGMVQIGLKVGAENLIASAKEFGFGQETHIDLPGEGEGILFNPKEMQDIDVASMSIGQGIAVTPLQMVQAFGVLANEGKLVHPHMIEKIVRPDGKVIREYQGKPPVQVIPKEVSEAITKILEQEVSSGGGINAHIDGYEFAGKTGTAQKLNAEGSGYLDGHYIASFIGYGPLPHPKFVILVVINDPKGMYYGGQIAAPVFRNIVSQLVRYYEMSPTIVHKEQVEGQEEMTVASLPVKHTEEGDVLVPDFTGWSVGEVRQWIVKAHLQFKPQGSGYAHTQSVPAGTAIEEGSEIEVMFQ